MSDLRAVAQAVTPARAVIKTITLRARLLRRTAGSVLGIPDQVLAKHVPRSRKKEVSTAREKGTSRPGCATARCAVARRGARSEPSFGRGARHSHLTNLHVRAAWAAG